MYTTPAYPLCTRAALIFWELPKVVWLGRSLNFIFQRRLASCWSMWNSDKAFWTQDWRGLQYFAPSFKLLLGDVCSYHLMFSIFFTVKSWAATNDTKMQKGQRQWWFIRFCLHGIRQRHAYVYVYLPAHAELNGKEKQQAAKTSYQTSSADLVRTIRDLTA